MEVPRIMGVVKKMEVVKKKRKSLCGQQIMKTKEKGEIRKLPMVVAQGVDTAGLGITTRSNSAKVEGSVELSITGTNYKFVGLLKAFF